MKTWDPNESWKVFALEPVKQVSFERLSFDKIWTQFFNKRRLYFTRKSHQTLESTVKNVFFTISTGNLKIFGKFNIFPVVLGKDAFFRTVSKQDVMITSHSDLPRHFASLTFNLINKNSPSKVDKVFIYRCETHSKRKLLTIKSTPDGEKHVSIKLYNGYIKYHVLKVCFACEKYERACWLSCHTYKINVYHQKTFKLSIKSHP